MTPEDDDYLSLRINPELKSALRAAAEREGRSVGNLVKYLIRQYCESEGFRVSETKPEYKISKKKK